MFKPVYYSIHAVRLTSNKKVALPQTQKYNFILYSPKNFLFFLKNLREYLMFSHFFLFVSDSLDRVEPCCLLCRIPSKENASKCTDCKTHNNAPRLYLGGYMEERVQTER